MYKRVTTGLTPLAPKINDSLLNMQNIPRNTYRRADDALSVKAVDGHNLDQSATSVVVTSPRHAPACR